MTVDCSLSVEEDQVALIMCLTWRALILSERNILPVNHPRHCSVIVIQCCTGYIWFFTRKVKLFALLVHVLDLQAFCIAEQLICMYMRVW